MPVQIKVLRGGDEEVLGSVASGLFDNPIDPKLAAEFLGDHRHHMAVAIHDGLVVGFASALHYVHPDKAPQLWINEVAVARQYRRQGLAKAILGALFEIARTQRCTVAWVLTDRTNVAAMALYSSVGGIEGADEESPSDGTLGYRFLLG
jgi:ribosomal protein S18 acetylase RimI-like enzyme